MLHRLQLLRFPRTVGRRRARSRLDAAIGELPRHAKKGQAHRRLIDRVARSTSHLQRLAVPPPCRVRAAGLGRCSHDHRGQVPPTCGASSKALLEQGLLGHAPRGSSALRRERRSREAFAAHGRVVNAVSSEPDMTMRGPVRGSHVMTWGGAPAGRWLGRVQTVLVRARRELGSLVFREGCRLHPVPACASSLRSRIEDAGADKRSLLLFQRERVPCSSRKHTRVEFQAKIATREARRTPASSACQGMARWCRELLRRCGGSRGYCSEGLPPGAL